MSRENMGVGKSLEKFYNRAREEKHIEILAVLEAVTNYPCLNAPRIAEKVEGKEGTVRWYLKKLLEKKLVEGRRLGGKIVYYTRGLVLPEDVEDLVMLQHSQVHILLMKIANNPGASKKGLLGELPMEHPSQAYVYIQHLEALVDKGFVRVLRDRKMNYYYLGDKLFLLYRKYEEREGKIYNGFVRTLNTVLPEIEPRATARLKERNLKENWLGVIVSLSPAPGVLAEYKLRLNPLWVYQEFIQPGQS
ncbi:MAG: hypothetical protein QW531_00505 [Thermoplasmata archaeon]